MSKPLKIFITYSHKDKAAKNELIMRLDGMKRQGLITIWHDNEILPGDDWRKDISQNLNDSDMLLYLVSAASLASENCNKELGIALNKNIRPIPIILEDCDWQNHQLGDIEALPDKGKPINDWQPESKGWQNVVDGIRKVVDKMRAQASDSAPEETERIFQLGNFLMMIGQIDKAIEAYSHVIKRNPRYTVAYNNRGSAYGDKGDLEKAIKDFSKAIELKPDFAEAYTNRGNSYSRKGELKKAIKDFDKAIKLKSDFAEAYTNRGNAYSRKEDLESAIQDYDQAIKLKLDDATAYYNRGRAYSYKGDLDQSIKDYSKAIELKSDFAEAYQMRGISYYGKDDYDRAIKDYDKVIELEPNNAKIYNTRGVTSLCVRNWNNARSDLSIAKYMGVDIILVFRELHNNIVEFEMKHDVKLPEDIAAMLTQGGRHY